MLIVPAAAAAAAFPSPFSCSRYMYDCLLLHHFKVGPTYIYTTQKVKEICQYLHLFTKIKANSRNSTKHVDNFKISWTFLCSAYPIAIYVEHNELNMSYRKALHIHVSSLLKARERGKKDIYALPRVCSMGGCLFEQQSRVVL